MSTKLLLAIVLNICAVLIPTGALYVRYGSERIALMGPDASGHLLALVATTVCAFLAGILSGGLIRSARESVNSTMELFKAIEQAEAPQPANLSESHSA